MSALTKRLSFLDRYLTVWIFLAMGLGIALGALAPGVCRCSTACNVGTTSVPIAVGLVLMMYPPLAKVRYEELPRVFRNGRVLVLSLVQNWVVGPLLMFALAVLFLRDRPEYMLGLILIGLARCIAMVHRVERPGEGRHGVLRGPGGLQLHLPGALLLALRVALRRGAAAVRWACTGAVIDIPWGDRQERLLYLGVPFLAGFLTRFGLRRRARATTGTARSLHPAHRAADAGRAAASPSW